MFLEDVNMQMKAHIHSAYIGSGSFQKEKLIMANSKQDWACQKKDCVILTSVWFETLMA